MVSLKVIFGQALAIWPTWSHHWHLDLYFQKLELLGPFWLLLPQSLLKEGRLDDLLEPEDLAYR